MELPGRTYSTGNGYRYSINGQEKTPEIAPNTTTAEYWQYDARIVRRWNVDPVFKEYESPYSAFANNPIINVDPDGSDTINITRKTTFDKRQERPPSISGNPNSHNRVYDPGNTGITKSGSIDIIAAAGPDIFRIIDLHTHIDENGKESTISSVTSTLELSSKASFYRSGGRNVKGYSDDRLALAANAPRWLLEHYEKKSGYDIGISSAIAYQKTYKFAYALNKIVSVGYAIFGVTSLIRGVLSMGGGGVAYTTVGRWMSQAELNAMNVTGRVVQGSGGQTFVTTGGASSYMGAAKGSIYVEFQVPTTSLLQGGKDAWFKMIGADANQAMKAQLQKQAGSMTPQFKNLSGILQTK